MKSEISRHGGLNDWTGFLVRLTASVPSGF